MKISDCLDWIDQISYINLDHRQDRKEHCEKELDRLQIKNRAERFSGTSLERGGMGCLLSHFSLIRQAKNRGASTLLILEDDVQFLNFSCETLYEGFCDLRSEDFWQLCYLGGRAISHTTPNSSRTLLQGRFLSTHAYIVNLQTFSPPDKTHPPIDIWYSNNCHSWMVYPMVATQYVSISDITHRKSKSRTQAFLNSLELSQTKSDEEMKRIWRAGSYY